MVLQSGKTVILIKKALLLRKLYSEWNILIVCFNKPLQNYLNQQLASANIEVRTIHSWYSYILSQWEDNEYKELLKGRKTGKITTQEYFNHLPSLVEKRLTHGDEVKKYHAILIDEGQDLEKMWFSHLKQAHLNIEEGLFLVCIDGLQAIHIRKRNRFRWVDVGIKARGRTKYLRKNYRNQSVIGKYALNKISAGVDNTSVDEAIQNIQGEIFLREGGAVKQQKWKYSEINYKLMLEILKLDPKLTIMIIVHHIKQVNEISELNNMLPQLMKAFPKQIIDCVSSKDGRKLYATPNHKFIPIYSIYRSKGLEADVVFYLHTSRVSPKEEYVAITRAREILFDIIIRL